MAVIAHGLKSQIVQGNQCFPFYIGTLSASQLAAVAEAPSFTDATSHEALAKNVLNPPVSDWQRPLNEGKWQSIRDRFSQTNEIMPNPVLLAVGSTNLVSVSRQHLVGGQQTDIFEVNIDNSTSKPLWILDGQHRIKGLSESLDPNVPVPFVLLYDETGGAYNPALFAKVFAQVTTEAEPLNALHREWLQYVFRLGEDYAPNAAGQPSPAWNAMSAVATMCSQQLLSDQTSNMWFDKIQFNPGASTPPVPVFDSGFAYQAADLKALIVKHYYKRPLAGHPALDPGQLANQLGLAIRDLRLMLTGAQEKCAFSGDSAHRQQYLQDSFLVGVLEYLRMHGVPESWVEVFTGLNFNNTDWNVKTWVVSTGGKSGTVSKRVSQDVFRSIFNSKQLPLNVADACRYLNGDESFITVEHAQFNTAAGKRIGNISEQRFATSGTKTLDIGSSAWLRIKTVTANVGQLVIIQKDQPMAGTYAATELKRGVVLDTSSLPVTLLVSSEHYGGVQNTLTLTIKN